MNTDLLNRAVNDIEFFLNPKLSGDQKLIEDISAQLAQGRLVVIKNAFQEAFAERMFTCLNQFRDWKLYEDYQPHFHYHHHNIYNEKLFPPELAQCREIFSSDETKHFAARLSQRDCSGETTLSASLYRPGDHSLPHNDFLTRDDQPRQTAFVWHLTKEWQDDWGGAFYWCKEGRSLIPAFNTLLLFNVDPNSKHFVTLVSPHAQGKRLAISGWWHGRTGSPSTETLATAGDEGNLVEIV